MASLSNSSTTNPHSHSPTITTQTPMILLSNISNLVSYSLNSEGVRQENPLYQQWISRDQRLLTLINSTLSPSSLSLVVGQTTAHGVWSILEKRYTSASWSNILNLKMDLHNIKKDSADSVNTYLQKIKDARDRLGAISVQIDSKEILRIIRKGLPREYHAFSTTIRTRNNATSFEDMHVLLTAEKQSLKASTDLSKDQSHMAMFVNASRNNAMFSPQGNRGCGRNNYNHGRGRNYNNNNSGRGGYNNSGYNNLRNPNGNFGHNNGFNSNFSSSPNQSYSQRPSCQICGKSGHAALDCYHRMDYSYQGKQPPTKLVAMVATSNAQHLISPTGFQIQCNRSLHSNLSTIPDHQDYTGGDLATIGNGHALPITHIGPTTSTQYHSFPSIRGPLPFNTSLPMSSSSSLDVPVTISPPVPNITPATESPISPAIPAPPPVPSISIHPMQTSAKSSISKRKQLHHTSVINYLNTEPPTFKVDSQFSQWQDAMLSEFQALQRQETWTLLPPSSEQNLVGCHWVYKLKRNSDGSIACYKVRLITMGYHQQGMDFDETFSPVPPGFVDSDYPRHVCKLQKALYGLNQVPRVWFERFTSHLLTTGFTPSLSDPSLFMYHHGTTVMFLLLYVDDIIITGNDSHAITSLLAQLSKVGDPMDHRSTTGLTVFLGHNPITWQSKKQPTVSHSSTEAEYKALANCTADLAWVRILKNFGVFLRSPPTIWCDNLSALPLASNPIFHARTKHVEIDYHFVQEKVTNKDLQLHHISTDDQLADVLTKALPSPRFLYLHNKLMPLPFRHVFTGG
uniref:CCHC-type domain-containing protein n=1 Tax=Fagus sylvatica TaxID=28930 RepID=A0A2N9HVG8_FAGSY